MRTLAIFKIDDNLSNFQHLHTKKIPEGFTGKFLPRTNYSNFVQTSPEATKIKELFKETIQLAIAAIMLSTLQQQMIVCYWQEEKKRSIELSKKSKNRTLHKYRHHMRWRYREEQEEPCSELC